jgi:hypothetical protein
MKIHLSIAFLILVLGAATWFLTNYVFITEEERIYRLIETARESVEEGSILRVSNILASDYQDAGGADKATVTRILFDVFQKSENRRITVTDIQLEVEENQATAVIQFTVQTDYRGSLPFPTGGLRGPEPAAATARVGFEKENGNWKVKRTHIY